MSWLVHVAMNIGSYSDESTGIHSGQLIDTYSELIDMTLLDSKMKDLKGRGD